MGNTVINQIGEIPQPLAYLPLTQDYARRQPFRFVPQEILAQRWPRCAARFRPSIVISRSPMFRPSKRY